MWVKYLLHLTKLILWCHLIFWPFANFSLCLHNMFYNQFVQIRIWIRSMHHIWLLGLSHWYSYHPVFGMPFICWQYWLFSGICHILDLSNCVLLVLTRSSSLTTPSDAVHFLLSHARQHVIWLSHFWWCQEWPVGLALGSLVYYKSSPLTFHLVILISSW